MKQRYCQAAIRTLVATLFAGGVWSAGAQSLTSLYVSAGQYDATVTGARAQLEAARARGEQARAGLYPTVGLSAGLSRSRQSATPDGGTTTDRSYGTRNAAIALSQPLYRPANRAAVDQGAKQVGVAEAALLQAEQDLIVRLSQAYFDVLAAQDTLQFVDAQKAAIAEQLAAAKRNFEVGTSTITDTREAQARFDLVLAQEVAAQNDLQVKRLALENISGVTAAEPKPVRPNASLPSVPAQEMTRWVQQSVANHPSVKQAKAALEVVQLELQKAEAAHHPTLDLTASYGNTRSDGGTSSSATGSRVQAGALGLAFNWALFAGYAHENRIKETLALIDKAKADVLVAERAVTQVTRNAFLALLSNNSQVTALQAAERSSQSALDANRLGYQVGVRINIDVLNAQSQLYQTKRDLAKARYDTIVTSLRLKQASGNLTSSDLDAISALLMP